jgi:hypothetical protein
MTDEDFCAVVIRHKEGRGIGTRALARAVFTDAGHLSRVLRGLKPCSSELAAAIDAALGAGGEITEAAARPEPGTAAAREYVAPELAGYFSAELAGHYAADRFLGPGRLIPVALSQYDLVCDVAGKATGTLRAELWGVAAGFAALLGWLHQDAGDLRTSERWHDVMIERAHRSGDAQLLAFALYCKAMLQTDMLDGPGTLDLAAGALAGGPALCPKARVLLLQQAAHGTSLAGGDGAAGECARLLDEAEELLPLAGDDGYPWGSACKTPRYVDVQRATALTRLGLAVEAACLWGEVIPAIPASSRRDLGVFRARHALALALAGEPEQAAALAAEVAPLVAATGSARMRAELSALRQPMRRWRGQRPWRDLEDALATMPRAGKGK